MSVHRFEPRKPPPIACALCGEPGRIGRMGVVCDPCAGILVLLMLPGNERAHGHVRGRSFALPDGWFTVTA